MDKSFAQLSSYNLWHGRFSFDDEVNRFLAKRGGSGGGERFKKYMYYDVIVATLVVASVTTLLVNCA